MLLLDLAVRDMRRDWVYTFCNVAMLAGVIVPLLVLFGVRNGVYETLVGRLLSDPATMQIDTRGNHAFSHDDADEVRAWPEAGFVTLKTRSLFDFINVRRVGERSVRDAILSPSGTGDPMLPIAELEAGQVVVSSELAQTLKIETGQTVELITQSSGRAQQLMVPAIVAGIVPADRLGGRTVLADIEMLDLVEAFYDQYALPDHGIMDGRPLASRVVEFEGLRVFARSLEDLAPLQDRVEQRFGISTTARTAQVVGTLALGKNLSLALLLTASVAAVGLAAALTSSFWAEVHRKRPTLASLALLGLTPGGLVLFPVIQAAVTALLGLLVSFGLFGIAAQIAERMFDLGQGADANLVAISAQEFALIGGCVVCFVILSSIVGAYRALAVDPAMVLRGG